MKDYSNYYEESKSRIISGGEKLFELHLNGFDAEETLINGVNRKLIITEKYSTKEILRKVIDKHGRLNYGDTVYYLDRYWLIRKIDNENTVFDTATMEYSPSSLKWLDEDGETQEYHFIFNTENLSNFGIDEGKIISLPNDRRNIAIKKDEISKKITLGQRFIFDDAAWKVLSINRLNPLIDIVLQSDSFDDSKDNLELRIANYYGNVANYSISILNGNIGSIKIDDRILLNVEVKNNDDIIKYPLVEFVVSDPSVASIDISGWVTPLSVGSVVITAKYKNVSTSISINIINSVVNNTTVQIIGDNSIKYTMSKVYSCEFRNNGVIKQDKSNFWITAEDGTTPSTLAIITDQDPISNTCTVKAASTKGVFILHVENSNQLIYGYKTIAIKSIF